VAQKLEELGGKVTHFAFEFNGLQTWKVSTAASTEGGNNIPLVVEKKTALTDIH
jgi:hypothetical protein